LDKQNSIESIRSLSWKQFEELLAEAYRRKGYRVAENTSGGADGGIDLRLERNGNSYLVQCKQWKSIKVGVNIVREMYGVMTHEKADGVIIVTSGLFTEEARTFASGKPIDLIEGQQLVEMIGGVQAKPIIRSEYKFEVDSKVCPKCGKTLAVREARRGSNAGNKFWDAQGIRIAGIPKPMRVRISA
jgi:restriction system protein